MKSLTSPLVALLKKSGYNVIVAVDGLDALERARDHKGEIHLLLSNVQMPRMTGIELATQLCIERPELGILLISGGAAGMLVLNHDWHFLPKPLMFQILKQTIESMLKGGGWWKSIPIEVAIVVGCLVDALHAGNTKQGETACELLQLIPAQDRL